MRARADGAGARLTVEPAGQGRACLRLMLDGLGVGILQLHETPAVRLVPSRRRPGGDEVEALAESNCSPLRLALSSAS